MWLYPIFNWFSNDPVGRSIAWGTAILSVVWGYLTLRDRRVRKQLENEMELEAEKTKDKAIRKLEKEADETSERATRAADSVPDSGVTSDSLPDTISDGLFSDRTSRG